MKRMVLVLANHVSLLRPHKCLAMEVGSIGNKP